MVFDRSAAEKYLFGGVAESTPEFTKASVSTTGSEKQNWEQMSGEKRKKRRCSGSPREKKKKRRSTSPEESLESLYKPVIPYEEQEEAPNPKFLRVNLYEHQKKALKWMIDREKKRNDEDGSLSMVRGGILADDMGLGKTLVSISNILVNLGDYRDSNPPTLVVAPLSVIQNWEEQLSVHAQYVLVSVYYGASKRRNFSKKLLLKQDVVITTYGVVAAESRVKDSILFSIKFARVILDEAHMIKNRQTKTAEACFALKAKARWCLTGTPVQNNVHDLFSLIKFLQVEHLNDWKKWCTKINVNPTTKAVSSRALNLLRKLLGTLCLRRLKTMRVGPDNRLILSLPPVTFEVLKTDMEPSIQAVYQKIYRSASEKFRKMIDNGKRANVSNILWVLLRLRQLCCHRAISGGQPKKNKVERKIEFLQQSGDQQCPNCKRIGDSVSVLPCCHFLCNICLIKVKKCPLCARPFTPSEAKSVEDSSALSELTKAAKSPSGKLKALLRKIKAIPSGEKCIVFSQFTRFLDISDLYLRNAGFETLRLDGRKSAKERFDAIREFQNGKPRVFLVSLKAGGVGLNLTRGNNVYLLDPWWNPSTEDQAIDRVNRIGQTRPVKVVRFIVRDTIEEKILELHRQKRLLANRVLGGGGGNEQMNDLKIVLGLTT